MSFLELQNVSKSFGNASVLKDVNLSIGKGEFVAIVGFSGAGKTTLISLMAGLLKPTSGSLKLNDQEITGPGPERGIVFQNYSLLPWLSVFENILLAVESVNPDWTTVQRHEHVEKYIAMVNLTAARNKKPGELSQGMRQRVGIARAFALKPKMLLLDEPFGMLDSLTRYELQQVLIELWRKNKITALMVTHDVDEALFLSDRIVCMTDGPEAEVGEIMEVNFPRPRERKAVMEHPDYYKLREELIEFLEVRAHKKSPVAHIGAGPADSGIPVSPTGLARARRKQDLLNPV